MKTIPLFETASAVPLTLGNLHLENIELYDNTSSGARFSYGNGVTAADVYLYDEGIPYISDDLESEEVKEFFVQAFGAVFEAAEAGAYTDFEPAGIRWLQLPECEEASFHWASFLFRYTSGPMAGYPERFVSHLLLRTDGGYLNKVRYTCPVRHPGQKEELSHFLHEWYEAVQTVLKQESEC